MSSQFALQTSFDVEYAPASIKKWRSKRTGLSLTYVNQPTPMVNGYFAVATEIPDDSGCPHTLEHLVFMGSKKYPYKGLLDSLGQRFFSYTNAWTAIDRTVYTLTTAGWEGFQKLLPIYLDHVFNPTIDDEACLTEVYHIDGKGKEKGVVFSEMQGIESQSWFVLYLEYYRALYSKESGYSSETGGLMSELRHLTWDQIRNFHKAMYRPDNVGVIITGSVDEKELLETMEQFDAELPSLPETPHKRPWIDSKVDLPLTEAVIREVEFPDDDETMGELLIGWIGPSAEDTLAVLALDMVGCYLAESPISLLNKHLVEVENPSATDIDVISDDFLRIGTNFYVGGIPVGELYNVDKKIKELLDSITKEENFDLTYMRQIVAQQKIKFVSKTEGSPLTFSNVAISEVIYGNRDGSDLSKWSKSLKEQDELATWSAKQWCDFIKTNFVDSKPVTIIGKPSAQAIKDHKAGNRKRNKDIREHHGEEGLLKLQKTLNDAQEKNDAPIPDEVLTKFGKPDASKIDFIETESYKAGNNKTELPFYKKDGSFYDIIQKDTPADFPLYVHLEDYKSQFVTAQLVFSSAVVPPELLRYFSLIEDIFSVSITKPDGSSLPYEEVITELNNDLLDFDLDNGFDSQFVELITVTVKFEVTKYDKAIQWLIDVLKYSVFEESRVRVIIEKLINSLPDKKRNDELMMYSSQYRTVYKESSLRKSQDSIYTENFYRELMQKIEDGKFDEITSDINTIKEKLFNVNNMKLFLTGGCSKLENPISSWSKFIKEFDGAASEADLDLERIPRSYQFKSEIGQNCSGQAFLVTTPASDTTHLIAMTPIPTDYSDIDIARIALASEILSGMEGPLWRGIRGSGLAYDASIRRMVESGFLTFVIYRGSDAQQAWETTKKIIHEHASGEVEIDQIAIDNAVAGIVNSLVKAESNNHDAAVNKVLDNIFKKRGPNYGRTFLKSLTSVTKQDLLDVLKKFFVPLFEPKKSLLFSCLPTTTAPGFQEFLEKQGYEVDLEEVNAASDEAAEKSVGEESEGSGESDDSDESSGSESEDED
ncbi:hypothetical protein FT663_00537 [Candidozyma haemuli var. vulneris]|uniref:Mitochondrial presequence protease n=1 Tax=Candidozyma haemuli TaxID=45357 RepID=A0A2V1B087_9ASCO|nr:hypothetical protein CXQ85_004010 [[Candida] haemuloni]KAF3993263.1 hypothetical protein FT662_00643 [[Candida] haemuloni var. vulneris]KAF3995319.1 hypothetical protein FT663_00537 [[Candida] haemuloni var. vulneris]PVH23717.1 hypothetical protein CXQ85_004010 [[Candida] haemuloni]